MGIHRDTLNEWKSRFPDISDALKVGRENADYIVENELFESCDTHNDRKKAHQAEKGHGGWKKAA